MYSIDKTGLLVGYYFATSVNSKRSVLSYPSKAFQISEFPLFRCCRPGKTIAPEILEYQANLI